jgi:hypothetical protein
MRWSIIRLIWLRELRDQLRDRRTIFMIAVLPVLLYPAAGFGVLQLARGFLSQKNIVGVAGVENLLPWAPSADSTAGGFARPGKDVAPVVAWLAFTPPPPGTPLAGLAHLSAAAALSGAHRAPEYPPLVEMQDGRLSFVDRYLESGPAGKSLVLQAVPIPLPSAATSSRTDSADFLQPLDLSLLNERKIDLLLVVPPGF